MARPEKPGVDYFPLDTTWEINMKLIKAKFKLTGVGCVVELWKDIYAQGYVMNWDPDSKLLFASENGIEIELLDTIISFAADRGIFDKRLLEDQGILTSHGIQKRWKRIVRDCKRKNTEIPSNLDLTGTDEFPPEETEFTTVETEFPPEFSTQRTEQKNTGKNSSPNLSSNPVTEFKFFPEVEKKPLVDIVDNLTRPTEGPTTRFTPEDLVELATRFPGREQLALDALHTAFMSGTYTQTRPWFMAKRWFADAGSPEDWLDAHTKPRYVQREGPTYPEFEIQTTEDQETALAERQALVDQLGDMTGAEFVAEARRAGIG